MKALYGDTSIPVQVCKSAGGYYIGRLNTEGDPYARDSVEYFSTALEAHEALITDDWTLREHP